MQGSQVHGIVSAFRRGTPRSHPTPSVQRRPRRRLRCTGSWGLERLERPGGGQRGRPHLARPVPAGCLQPAGRHIRGRGERAQRTATLVAEPGYWQASATWAGAEVRMHRGKCVAVYNSCGVSSRAAQPQGPCSLAMLCLPLTLQRWCRRSGHAACAAAGALQPRTRCAGPGAGPRTANCHRMPDADHIVVP